jgi:solute carrier family 9 (sodium/hydrogen exchanger), member 3
MRGLVSILPTGLAPQLSVTFHVPQFMDHLMAGMEDIIGKTGNYNVRDKFKRFDNRFIRPYLIRDLKVSVFWGVRSAGGDTIVNLLRQGAEPKILETYSKLTMRDAMDFMRRNPSTIGQMSGTESMSALFRNYTGYFGGRCAPSLIQTW